MIELIEAKKQIEEAVKEKHLCLVIGKCFVEYWGRAASKLPLGKRLLLIKGDNSFAIHQNKLLRPTNYMMNATVKCELLNEKLIVSAQKLKPKEKITVSFDNIEFVKAFEMAEKSDLRLFGSEKELSNELMKDLSFIEPGLKPLMQEKIFRKGIVDIIAEDANKNLVVVEVKRRQADFTAVTQLQRYMKQVEKMKNRKTRGILIAPDIRKNALELLENYGLEYYKLDFEISNPKSTIKGVQKKQPTIREYLNK